jgi:signal transduction histidine kinase
VVPNATAIEVSEICQVAIDLHSAAAAAKGIELRSRLDLPATGESRVLVDEVKLFEIVNNLVANAIKSTRSGFEELGVHLSRSSPLPFPQATLNVEVRDSGPGIAAGDLPKVFVPFYQVDGGPDRRSGGIGLGLSIVKDLVVTLSGTIDVDSIQGIGSSFRVALPVELLDAGRPAVRGGKLACPRRSNLLAPRVPPPNSRTAAFYLSTTTISTPCLRLAS